MSGAGVALALVGVVVGPLVTFFIARWQFSGAVDHSEASDLWAESAAIRTDYRLRIKELEDELVEARKENAELRVRVGVCERRLAVYESEGGEDMPGWLQ